MTENTNTELAINAEETAPAYAMSRMPTTLDLTVQANKDLALFMFNSAESLNDRDSEEPLQVIALAFAPGVRRSRDANVPDAPCTNTYIMCDTGECFMTQSSGIAESAQQIASVYPDCNRAQGGLSLRVLVRNLPGGRTIKRLVPATIEL